MVLIKKGFSQIKILVSEMKSTWRRGGFKGLYKRYGWKLFAGFFVYYLIRDVTLYIILPWYIANRLMK